VTARHVRSRDDHDLVAGTIDSVSFEDERHREVPLHDRVAPGADTILPLSSITAGGSLAGTTSAAE
jgi:hypothetical protein